MAMRCNIDAKGKRVRLVGGLVTLAVAAVFAGLTLAGVVGGWGWAVAAAAAVGGGFQVFEARAGWCALRAMGVKTPF